MSKPQLLTCARAKWCVFCVDSKSIIIQTEWANKPHERMTRDIK